jgi:hypothetical protein
MFAVANEVGPFAGRPSCWIGWGSENIEIGSRSRCPKLDVRVLVCGDGFSKCGPGANQRRGNAGSHARETGCRRSPLTGITSRRSIGPGPPGIDPRMRRR